MIRTHIFSCQAPTHFCWLLLFFLSHSSLNFCAELLCFGDRRFYGDWWSVAHKQFLHTVLLNIQHWLILHRHFIYRNATTLITLWKNWNIPCQKWCHRYFSNVLKQTSVFTHMTGKPQNVSYILLSQKILLLVLPRRKACIHPTGGKQCVPITCRISGLPYVCSSL